MSFLNKFKKEFEGLNIGDRLQGQQQATQPDTGAVNHSSTSQPYYGYDQQPQSTPYQYHTAQGHHYQAQHGYAPQQIPPSAPEAPPTYSSHQHYHQQPGSSPSPAGNPYVHPPPSASAPYAPGSCPTPPRWIPHWSEHQRQWYYVETTGRSLWESPADGQPLPAMPLYPGSMSRQGHPAQPVYNQYSNTTPLAYPADKKNKGSSNTMLAAAGGFAAGGVAGYLVNEAIDKRKKKKRHGNTPEDFADFIAYPSMEVNLDCNICDQPISGPYAHCAKCDRGDWDVCRDCLAQGATCDGHGKHRLVKVYPKYWCNRCDQLIRGDFYHCSICDKGDWDVCQSCLDRGTTCNADGGHQLSKLYIPTPKFNSGKPSWDASSSSSSD